MFRSTRVCTSSTYTTGILLQLLDAESGRKTMMQMHLPIGLMTLHTHLLRLDGRRDASVGTREQKSRGGEGGRTRLEESSRVPSMSQASRRMSDDGAGRRCRGCR